MAKITVKVKGECPECGGKMVGRVSSDDDVFVECEKVRGWGSHELVIADLKRQLRSWQEKARAEEELRLGMEGERDAAIGRAEAAEVLAEERLKTLCHVQSHPTVSAEIIRMVDKVRYPAS